MKKFHKAIAFTKVPLKKVFRFGDDFQIYPANIVNMPFSESQRHYPVLVEYWTSKEDDVDFQYEDKEIKDLFSDTATKLSKLDTILSLLSVLSNHLFFRYKDMGMSWGMPILENMKEEEIDALSSTWNVNIYYFPNMGDSLRIDALTNIDLPQIELVRHFPYYQHDPNLDDDRDREITFPNTIYMAIRSYIQKPKEVKAVLDRAIAYLVSALELRKSKKTLSILASFTAIETMVSFEYENIKTELCERCGQPVFKVSARYRDYLLKYIGDSALNKKKFNLLYSLRSKIVHTGQLMKTENLFSDVPKEEREEEFLKHLEIIQMSKFAIIQWLLKNQ